MSGNTIDAFYETEDFQAKGLKLECYFRRYGNNGASRIPIIEFIGDRTEYLSFGKYVAKLVLTDSESDIVIRLTRRSDASINALLITRRSMPASIIQGLEIKAVFYQPQACQSIVTELPSGVRPWLGFLDSRSACQQRMDYCLPSWAKSVAVLQGSKLSQLTLAKLLMDLGSDPTPEFEGFCLTHQDKSVSSGSYEAGFWLSGSEYDRFEYSEYHN